MSGHSKWKNIAGKKNKTDAQRAKIFTKLSREIIVAVKEGGANIDGNSRLKDIVAKARAANLPADNINRVIARASGSQNSENYETVTYEGYGPSGVAVIVRAMTDNRNRTAAEVRHHFDKFGGNMGAAGCVSWSFDEKGVIVIERGDQDEDEVMLTVLDAGAEDFDAGDEVFEVYTAPEDLGSVRDGLEAKGFTFLSAEIEMVPQNYTKLTDEDDIKNMTRLLERLEDDDDVTNVWHNWDE